MSTFGKKSPYRLQFLKIFGKTASFTQKQCFYRKKRPHESTATRCAGLCAFGAFGSASGALANQCLIFRSFRVRSFWPRARTRLTSAKTRKNTSKSHSPGAGSWPKNAFLALLAARGHTSGGVSSLGADTPPECVRARARGLKMRFWRFGRQGDTPRGEYLLSGQILPPSVSGRGLVA